MLSTPGHTGEHLSFLLLDGVRELGVFAVGALLAGAIAGRWRPGAAVWAVAALTAASGLLVAARMYETHPKEHR